MTDQEFLARLLDLNQPMTETPTRFSTIALLLRGGRKLFGCDLASGEYERNELNIENFENQTYHSFQFSGLINYLIFLEQVGSIFKPKNSIRINKTNGIFCSLKYFSSLSDENKINSIKALRNSLTHKFGLATERNPKEKPPRKFLISIERDSEIVKLPNKNWDGEFSDKSDNTSTTIFIIDLIILIERVYQKIVEANKADKLEIVLNDGMEELKARFTIVY
ncbi:MAG TPA: hypothetical protein VIJ75_16115 [Hanamia sp.]